jgi:hypothetical protein
MALIDKVKAALRITDSNPMTTAETLRSTDIADSIAAAKDDLIRCGWQEAAVNAEDDRVIEAVKLYVKGRLDFQGKGPLYMENYRLYRNGNVLDVVYQETEVQPSDV